MLQLNIREKRTNNFSDDIFDYSVYGERTFSYLRNQEEVYIDIAAGLPNWTSLVENYVRPNTTYRVKLKLYDNGSTGTSQFYLTNELGSNFKAFDTFNTFNDKDDNSQVIIYTTSPDYTSMYFKIRNGTGLVDVNLVSISFEEIGYTGITIEDGNKGIFINSGIKNVTEYENYRVAYSNNFNVILDNFTNNYLKFKNINGNSNIDYFATISDDYFDLFSGTIRFGKTFINNGIDVIECMFIEDVSNFFKDLKDKKLVSLDNLGLGLVSEGNMFVTMNSPAIQKELSQTIYYGIVDNGNINNLNIDTNIQRSMSEHSYNGYNGGFRNCHFSINDVYPSIYIRKLWDEIHKEQGLTYNSDNGIFTTDNFNALLLNYWENFRLDEEEINSRNGKVKLGFSDTVTGENIELQEVSIIQVTEDINGLFNGSYYEPVEDTIMSAILNIQLNVSMLAGATSIPANLNNSIFYNVDATINIYFAGQNNFEYDNVVQGNYFARFVQNISFSGSGSISKDFSANLDYNLFSNQDTYIFRTHIVINKLTFTFNGATEVISGNSSTIGDILGIDITGDLSLKSHSKLPPQNVFDTRKLLPDMKQSDFIKQIANLFNLRFIHDIGNKHIDWYTFDEFYIKDSEIIDYTNKIDIKNIEKQNGSAFQADRYNFKYLDIKDYVKLIPNNEFVFGNKEIVTTGEHEQAEKNTQIGFALQDFRYAINGSFPITINNSVNNIQQTPYSSAVNRDMYITPFLSYQNIVSFNESLSFRNSVGERTFYNTLPTSSPLLNLRKLSETGDVFSLEFKESQNTSIVYKDVTVNHYDAFFKNDWNDIINKDAELMTINVHLTNMEHNLLKLNTIISYLEQSYRINTIKDFNENTLTEIELLKVTFNPHYTGTTINPTPFINISSGTIGYPYVLTNSLIYTSAVNSFEITYNHLDNDLIVYNNGDDSPYQISLDGITFSDMNNGDSLTIRTAGSLVNGETITIYYRLYLANSSIGSNDNIDSVWDFKSSDTVNSVGLHSIVRLSLVNVGGSDSETPMDIDANIITSSDRIDSGAFETTLTI